MHRTITCGQIHRISIVRPVRTGLSLSRAGDRSPLGTLGGGAAPALVVTVIAMWEGPDGPGAFSVSTASKEVLHAPGRRFHHYRFVNSP